MKIRYILTIVFLMIIQLGWTQEKEQQIGPLTYGLAPSFKAASTMGEITFPENYFGKWKIIFSHPADFTPVCTSEIMALVEAQDEFKDLNTSILVLSTDGLNSHIEWVKSIEGILSSGGGKKKIEFPLITDSDLKISKAYGILHTDYSPTRDVRGVFFIDPENKIRAFFKYPSSVGRNIAEIKRTLIALQTEDKYNVLIPGNWNPGDEVLLKSPATAQEADKIQAKNNPDLRQAAWYLWYKKL